MTTEDFLKEIQKAGLADDLAVNKLRRESVLANESIEAAAFRTRLIDDQKLAKLKSDLLKVPYKKIGAQDFDAKALDLIPEETARTYGVVPLQKKDNLLVVGMVFPDDSRAQEALKFIARSSRLNLGVYLISYGDWQEILKHYSSYRTELQKAVEALGVRPKEGIRKLIFLEESGSGEDAPIVKIVANTLREAVSSRASDVHFEPQQNYLRVRFRVDGDLREAASLPAEISQPVVSRIKVISNLKLDETRIPQDGRFRSKILDREIDFRVSTFPTPLGEKMAVRILDPTTGLKNFEDLDIIPPSRKKIEAGLARPFGMVLITGPTGSGKTTTLYAMLQRLNNESVNIVSLEDPVEYFVEGVNQSQVKPEIGYDFPSGLRQILRQDPDIIMVGEIRDNETAELAVHAALTGHIVLSTLHTNNAAGVIPRMIDMKVEPFLLPASLTLMLSQRLLGLLCENCKASENVPASMEKAVKTALADLPEEISAKYQPPYKIWRSKGCNVCKGKGTIGRIAIFEVLEMTPALEEVINGGPTVQKILKEAKNQKMITLRQNGIVKALDGKVALEEVLRETEEI